MSDLPKYERISNMEHDDVELSSHIQGAGGGRMGCAPSTSMLTPRQAVTSYSFYPSYPMRGNDQHVVGKQGSTKDETIDLIYRYFPQLSSISPERINLSVPRSLNTGMDDIPETPLPHPHAHSVAHAHPPQRVTVTDSALHWAKISDDAWQGLRGDGLRLVRVDVEDAPGDSRRRALYYTSLILGPIFGFLAFIVIVIMITGAYASD